MQRCVCRGGMPNLLQARGQGPMQGCAGRPLRLTLGRTQGEWGPQRQVAGTSPYRPAAETSREGRKQPFSWFRAGGRE